ncbi:hypothetical protein ABBQ32_012777 [Trebouxia sp. C0010 RCD-2024]
MGDNTRISFPTNDVFWQRLSREHLEQIDNQGRCIITDHGSFVLLNVYAPAVTNIDNERFPMKMTLYQACPCASLVGSLASSKVLQHRIATMLAQGRPVVLVGDLNIAPYLPDHCDWCGRASQPSAQSQFLHHRPDRQWFQSILSTGGGPLTDIFRKFHTDRERAYTVWNQKTGARATNYGSRVDFILAAGPKAAAHSPARAAHAEGGTTGAAANSSAGVAHAEEVRTGGDTTSPARVAQAEEARMGAAAGSPATTECAAGSSSAVDTSSTFRASSAASEQAQSFVDSFTGSDLWVECMGSDHCPVWATLDVPTLQLPQAFLAPALSTSHTNAGQAHTISSWLSHSLTAAKGRKRPRKEEEETPPRPTLDDLEEEDRAQQQATPGRAVLGQPQVAGPSGSKGMRHPQAERDRGRSVLEQGRASPGQGGSSPEQTAPGTTGSAPGVQAVGQGALTISPATKHPGQSSITDFLSIAGQSTQTGMPDQAQGASEAQSPGQSRLDQQPSPEGGFPEKPTEPASMGTGLPSGPMAIGQMAHRAPLCRGHQEPCVRKRVNKSGPNKGRYFYMCAKPPAAGDEGQCKTFKWADGARR